MTLPQSVLADAKRSALGELDCTALDGIPSLMNPDLIYSLWGALFGAKVKLNFI